VKWLRISCNKPVDAPSFNLNNGVPINDEVDLGIQMIIVFNDAWQACGVAMDKYFKKGINVVNW
jgi:hypothetical protein